MKLRRVNRFHLLALLFVSCIFCLILKSFMSPWTLPITEDEDLTFLSKPTFWRVGHDLFHFANKVIGMDWDQV